MQIWLNFQFSRTYSKALGFRKDVWVFSSVQSGRSSSAAFSNSCKFGAFFCQRSTSQSAESSSSGRTDLLVELYCCYNRVLVFSAEHEWRQCCVFWQHFRQKNCFSFSALTFWSALNVKSSKMYSGRTHFYYYLIVEWHFCKSFVFAHVRRESFDGKRLLF